MSDFVLEFVEITQTIGDGLFFGTTYALIGIGFTLIFGAMGKLNMTYAAAALAGGVRRLGRVHFRQRPGPVVFLISALASGLIGGAVYITCFRFIPINNHLAPLMASIGALFFIDENRRAYDQWFTACFSGTVRGRDVRNGPLWDSRRFAVRVGSEHR